jgi:DNA-binding CsgD family transcriptional regulator
VEQGAEALLEREAELVEIDRLTEQAVAADGRLVLIEGPPGIGKSRLFAAAREHARVAGMQVLGARGGELERDFSYGVVRQLFEPTLAAIEPAERAELLSGAAAGAGRLFAGGDPSGGVDAADPGASFQILYGLYWLTANLGATQPLFLGIDDLHWCDQPSVRFLSFLARRLEGLRALVVATVRPDEPGSDVVLLESLARDPWTRVIRPASLSEEATAHLVRQRLSAAESEFCTACHVATGGNPLLVIELTRALEAEGIKPTAHNASAARDIGPEAVSRAVRGRLSQLASEASALAEAAAVLGSGALLTDAARLAELDEQTAFSAAAALARASILRHEEVVEFVHPVIRAAIYSGLGIGAQRAAHARAARLLAESKHSPEEVAAHILVSRPAGDPEAVATLRAAAQRSLAHGAADVAVTYLRRALDEPPRGPELVDVLLELGSAEQFVHGASAAAHLREALELMESPARRARTALALGRALYFSDELGASIDVLQAALAGPSLDSEISARLEGMLLLIAVYNSPWSELARERLDGFDPNLPPENIGGRVLLALSAYHDARGSAPRTAVVERARRALEPPSWADDIQSVAYVPAADVLMAADLLDEAEHAVSELAEAGHATGSLFLVAVGCCFRSHCHLLRGALAQAVAEAWSAIEAAELHGHEPALRWSYGYLLQALLERGELEAAEEALERGGLTGDLPDRARFHEVLLGRGRIKIEQGHVRDGVEDLLEVGRRYEALGGRNPAILAWRSPAALGLHVLGENGQASGLAEEEAALAREWGAPRALAQALRAQGLVLGGKPGLALLHEAAEVIQDSPALLERAQSITELGAALRRANQRAKARELLQKGLDLANRCGARPLQERALAELVATGARPRRLTVSGRDSLTPSELRVAELATEGQTNREIAQRLFVTQKTVETHLGHVFRKLGLESRAQLAFALTQTAQPT